MGKPINFSHLLRHAEGLKRAVHERLLTPLFVAPGPHVLRRVLAKQKSRPRERYKNSNLVGVAVGAKEVGGKLSGDVAIRVYVSRKVPRGKLARRYLIPERIQGIPTDIVAIGKIRFQAGPVSYGTPVHRSGLQNGTLACAVLKPNESAWYILSAAHVLANVSNAVRNDPIFSGVTQQQLATLDDFQEINYEGESNTIDAAIARLDKKSDLDPLLPVIGEVPKETAGATIFQSVRKYGAKTGHTLGIITGLNAHVGIHNAAGEIAAFDHLIEVKGCEDPFSEGGDSGALVVDALTNRAVGMVVAGAGYSSFIVPIGRILERFKAQMLG